LPIPIKIPDDDGRTKRQQIFVSRLHEKETITLHSLTSTDFIVLPSNLAMFSIFVFFDGDDVK
jgi:hypothetical protein